MAASTAIDDKEERDNFFRLNLLLFRVGNQRFREFFKNQWPTVYQNKKGSLPPSGPWSDTPNDATEMNKIETKLKFQFKDQKTSFDSGNTSSWDFSLLTTVLINSSLDFVTPGSPESNAIKDVKEIRNQLICHAPHARIQTHVFNIEWTNACQALGHFGATQDEFDQVLQDVKKPIDSLLPILKECLSNEKEILEAIGQLKEKNEIQHRETLEAIQQGNEDIKKCVNEVKQAIKECFELKAKIPKELKMKASERELIQERLEYIEKDVIATELLCFLPNLTLEQKDHIAYNEKNYTTEKGLRTLLTMLEEFENGLEMFVRSLVKANLNHVALLLDPDCTVYEEAATTGDEENHNYVSIDGTVHDIRIPIRVLGGSTRSREMDLEKTIATSFHCSSSVDSKELRKQFRKFLPKGVYFVRTTQLGEKNYLSGKDMETDSAENLAKTLDSIVFVFRVSKVDVLDKLWAAYRNGDLKNQLTQVIFSSLSHNYNDLELEMVFEETDYNQIKKVLNEEVEKCESPVEASKDESMETPEDKNVALTTEKRKIRKVYLEGKCRKEIELRDYQKELAKPAFNGKNTIICAPTNSGKTFVAMEIAKRHLDAYGDGACKDPRKGKVVFIVNKQNLVFQQRARFEEYLSKYRISDISGNNSAKIKLKSLLDLSDVVVLTAQILVDAMDANKTSQDMLVNITDISLLLFDECHHTVKNGPYNMIMQSYLMSKRANKTTVEMLPQVVGLTASLGVGQATTVEKAMDHMLQICANLDAINISTVREHKEDLESHVSSGTTKTEVIEIDNNEPNSFEEEVNKTMKRIEDLLKLTTPPPTTDRQAESYRQWIEMFQNHASLNEKRDQFTCTEYLRSYHEALLINRFARTSDALTFLQDFFKKNDQSTFTDTCSCLHQDYQQTRSLIEHNLDSSQTQNPLLLEMQRLIIGFHENESSAKGIVFCRTKAFTVAIKKWIEETTALKDIVKPGVLLGGAGGQYSMTQAEQEAVIKQFKNGDINIIIATSVGEEGLDIADCSYVIRYGVKTNAISHVQSRGRVRAKEGNYVYLTDKRSRGAEHELKNQSKESLMDVAVEKVQRIKSEEFISEIQRIQANMGINLKTRKAESTPPAKSTIPDTDQVSFLCKKCSQHICYAHNIRRIYGVHHVVVNTDIYDKISVKPHTKKPYESDKIKFSEKVYCGNCDFDLGVVVKIQETKWPCFKIISFLVKSNAKQLEVKKKWKDFQYSITEVNSVEELTLAREAADSS